MNVRRILVCGYYGFSNAGDDAILITLLTDLRTTYPDAVVVVVAGDPEQVVRANQVQSFHWQDVARLIQEAIDADIMVLGGGGLFQEHHGFDPEQVLTSRHGTIGYYAGFALLAGMTSTPLIIYGVGVGPLNTESGRLYTRLAFRRASEATVRDEASRLLLAQIGVDTSRLRVTADAVWRLPEPTTETSEMTAMPALDAGGVALAHTRTIGVSVRPWGTPDWASPLAQALDQLVVRYNGHIVFLPFQHSVDAHEDDAQAAFSVFRRMQRQDRATVLEGDHTPADLMAIIGSCSLVLGMRLHSVIFAAKLQVPVFALSYDPKVDAVMEQLGLRGQTLSVSSLTAEAVVEGASRAAPAAADVVSDLRNRAASNRLALAGSLDPPPADEETTLAYAEIAYKRALDQYRLSTELERLQNELERINLSAKDSATALAEVTARLEQVLTSSSWKLTAPLRVFARLARAPRHTSLNLARRAYRRLPSGPLKAVTRNVAANLLGWRNGQGIAHAFTPSVPLRRLGTWPEFEESVLARRASYKGVFIQSVGIPWDVPLYQRPQHLAVALGRLGYLVIYRTRSDYELRDMQAAEEIAANVWLTEFDAVTKIQGAVTSYYSTGYWHSIEDYTSSRKRGAVVYEYIDHIDPAISGGENVDKLTALRDYAFSGGVDYIVASARALEREAKEVFPSRKIIYVPNGVDFEHYQSARQISSKARLPRALQRFLKRHPQVVGYFGALAPWLWYTMLHDLVALRPDLGFLFIGPDYLNAARNLPTADNLLWTGPVDYKILPAYAARFDIAIIPFEPGVIAQTTSPLKLFEYFALAKPVVVTSDMQECVVFDEVLGAGSAREFSEKIDIALALGRDPAARTRLLNQARKNDWIERARSLEVIFADGVSGKPAPDIWTHPRATTNSTSGN